jgi:hypothetical protein
MLAFRGMNAAAPSALVALLQLSGGGVLGGADAADFFDALG